MSGIFNKNKHKKILDNDLASLESAWDNDFDSNTEYASGIDDPLLENGFVDYATFLTSDSDKQKEWLKDAAFYEMLNDDEKIDLLKNHKNLLSSTFKDQGLDKFKEAIGADYYDQLDTELKNQLDTAFKGYGTNYDRVTRGASRLAGALEPALRIAAGSVKSGALDKALDYGQVAPVFQGGVAPNRPVQALPPEIIAAMKQTAAYRPQKTSDVITNLIGQTMGYGMQLDQANKIAQTMADWKANELQRFDKTAIDNAHRAGDARDKTMEAASNLYNKRQLYDSRLKAQDAAAKAKRKRETRQEWADRVGKAGEFVYESALKDDTLARENLYERIEMTRDLIEETSDPKLKGDLQGDLREMVSHMRQGYYDPYKTESKLPKSIWDLNAGWAGLDHLRLFKNGGKLIPKKK